MAQVPVTRKPGAGLIRPLRFQSRSPSGQRREPISLGGYFEKVTEPPSIAVSHLFCGLRGDKQDKRDVLVVPAIDVNVINRHSEVNLLKIHSPK